MRRAYKRIRYMLGALLVMALCVGLVPAKVAAAEGSITLHYLLSDCTFSMYHVADYANDGSFELTDDFAEVAVDWSALTTDNNWYALAQTLDSVVVSDAIAATVSDATDEDGTVSFTGLASGLYLMTAEVKADADGTYYTVTPLLITVPGTNSDGVVEYDRDITVTKYSTKTTTSIHVQKIWEGDDENQPTSITVGLYADGVLTETQELNDSNNWRYTWSDLDTDVKWTAAETEVAEGYTVAYSTADDGTIVITNTYEESEEPDTEPDTTDSEEPVTETPTEVDETDLTEDSEETEESEGSEGTQVSEDTEDTTTSTSSSEDSEEEEEKLPQTGLDWGPAAVLILIGLGCMLIGVIKNRLGRRSE